MKFFLILTALCAFFLKLLRRIEHCIYRRREQKFQRQTDCADTRSVEDMFYYIYAFVD